MNYLRQNGCGFQKRLLSQESFGYSFELLATLPFGIETPNSHYSGTYNLIHISEKRSSCLSRSRCDTLQERKNLSRGIHQKREVHEVLSPYHIS